jgi:toxin ParE1/3/4
MKLRWEESEYAFCDLQAMARFIRRGNPVAARSFLQAAYDTFEFLAQNPGVGRPRFDLGFPEVRSWHVEGLRRYLIFYREIPGGVQIWRVLHGSMDLQTELPS